jgi:hypothetical protein
MIVELVGSWQEDFVLVIRDGLGKDEDFGSLLLISAEHDMVRNLKTVLLGQASTSYSLTSSIPGGWD